MNYIRSDIRSHRGGNRRENQEVTNLDLDSLILSKYWHLLEKDADENIIEFLYGGRDSAKSYTIAEILLIECLTLPYFRCAFIREQSGDIKDSQWQLIKDIAEEWGVDRYLTFTKAPLEINCKNGNKFISRGCNEIQNLKSITACNRAWIEEGVKERNSMTVILGTIRSSESRVKIYYSFNPECEGNYHNWWLYEDWFAGIWNPNNLSFSSEREYEITTRVGTKRKIKLKYRVTHSTYHDNPYTTDERIALHESNTGYYYTVFTRGLFGYLITGGEFWTEFKSEKHVKVLEQEKDLPLHIVIDSNTAPYVTIAGWQVNEEKKKLRQIYELPCRSPNASSVRAARKLHNFLISIGYDDVIYLYGDSTANNESTVDENNKSFFEKFIEELESSGWIIEKRIAKTNPRVGLSGDFINDLYDEKKKDAWGIEINQSCVESIEDYTMAKKDKNGGVLKKMIINKETKVSYQERGHFTDTKRYFICWILGEDFKKYGNKKKNGYKGVAQGSRGKNEKYYLNIE